MASLEGNVLFEHQKTIAKATVWQKQTVVQMRQAVFSFGIKGGQDEVDLPETIKGYTNQRQYILSRISFSFARYGVWFEKGATRGHAGNTGRTVWKRKDGSTGRVNPDSIGKMNQGKAHAKPWFNPVLQKQYPELIDIVLEGKAQATVKEIANVLIK